MAILSFKASFMSLFSKIITFYSSTGISNLKISLISSSSTAFSFFTVFPAFLLFPFAFALASFFFSFPLSFFASYAFSLSSS